MSKWPSVVVAVLLVLTAAMGLRNLTVSASPDAPILVAHGVGPVPPTPWHK